MSNALTHRTAGPSSLVDRRIDPLGFLPLWFEPRTGHIWESQVLLTDGRVVFPGVSGFRPPLMKDRLDINEIFFKEP